MRSIDSISGQGGIAGSSWRRGGQVLEKPDAELVEIAHPDWLASWLAGDS